MDSGITVTSVITPALFGGPPETPSQIVRVRILRTRPAGPLHVTVARRRRRRRRQRHHHPVPPHRPRRHRRRLRRDGRPRRPGPGRGVHRRPGHGVHSRVHRPPRHRVHRRGGRPHPGRRPRDRPARRRPHHHPRRAAARRAALRPRRRRARLDPPPGPALPLRPHVVEHPGRLHRPLGRPAETRRGRARLGVHRRPGLHPDPAPPPAGARGSGVPLRRSGSRPERVSARSGAPAAT